jgi:hypothetical protein
LLGVVVPGMFIASPASATTTYWYDAGCYGASLDCWSTSTNPGNWGNLQYNLTSTLAFIPNGDGTQSGLNPCGAKPNNCFGGYTTGGATSNGDWCHDYSSNPSSANCWIYSNSTAWHIHMSGGAGVHEQAVMSFGTSDYPFSSSLASPALVLLSGQNPLDFQNNHVAYTCADFNSRSGQWFEDCYEGWNSSTITNRDYPSCPALMYEQLHQGGNYWTPLTGTVDHTALGLYVDQAQQSARQFSAAVAALNSACHESLDTNPADYRLIFMESGGENVSPSPQPSDYMDMVTADYGWEAYTSSS